MYGTYFAGIKTERWWVVVKGREPEPVAWPLNQRLMCPREGASMAVAKAKTKPDRSLMTALIVRRARDARSE